MKCVFCGETVVDDQFGKCITCNNVFHQYGKDGGPSQCGEEVEDGGKCRTCVEADGG